MSEKSECTHRECERESRISLPRTEQWNCYSFFSASFHPCLQRNSLRKTNHCLQNGSLRSSQGGTSREKREVSDICLFKEKQKGGVTLKMNRLTEREREREREMGIEKSFYHVKTDTYRREPDGLHWVYFSYVCVCLCLRQAV